MIERWKFKKQNKTKQKLSFSWVFSEIIPFGLPFFVVAGACMYCSSLSHLQAPKLEMGKYGASPPASSSFQVAIWFCSAMFLPSFLFPLLLLTDMWKILNWAGVLHELHEIIFTEKLGKFCFLHFLLCMVLCCKAKKTPVFYNSNLSLSCFSRQVSRCSYFACC